MSMWKTTILISMILLIQGCASKPKKKFSDKPDLSGIELPVLKNLNPKEINFRLYDQRKGKYSGKLKGLISEYKRILMETFRKSGFRVSRRASNGISFYIREEKGKHRKRLRHCVYISGRLRSREGHWINVGTSACDKNLNANNALSVYLELFKENLNDVFRPMDEKLLL